MELFKKSKLTKRSPPKTNEGYMSEMMHMMKTLMNTNGEIMNEIKEIRKEQISYKQELEKIREENKSLREEIKLLKLKTESMDKERRRNNIIVTGLEMDSKNEMKDIIEGVIKEELQVEAKIKKVTGLGKRTCLVELESEVNKIDIMKNKNKLRNMKGAKVYINNDLTVEERKIQKIIREVEVEEKRKGNKTKVGYKKLFINDAEWKWDAHKEKLVNTMSKPKN